MFSLDPKLNLLITKFGFVRILIYNPFACTSLV